MISPCRIIYLGKALGFELGAPPHVQIRELFEGIILVIELKRCEKIDFSQKWCSYWRRDPYRVCAATLKK